MLRSASFAFLVMLRVCCVPHASKFCRVALRMHDVHCGSSVEVLSEAIVRVVVEFVPVQRKVLVVQTILAILAAEAEGASGRCYLP